MGVARVTVFGNIAGQLTNNVLHFQKSDTVLADYSDLAARVRDWFCINPFSLNCSAHQSWNRIHVVQLGGTFIPIDLAFAAQGTWDASLDYTPTVAVVFRLLTGLGGRRGRGRFYMGGFGSRAKNQGLWEASIQLQLNACANAIADFWVHTTNPNYKGNGWVLGICPRGNDPTLFLTVDQVVARPMIGVLRRRQLGVGA